MDLDCRLIPKGEPMPGAEFPIRTPTAVVFFIIAVMTAHYSLETPALRPFAVSAFWFFLALGPVRWMENCILSTPYESQIKPRELAIL